MHLLRHGRAAAAPFGFFAWLLCLSLCLSLCLGSSASAAPSSTSSPLIAVPPMRSLVTDTSSALTPAQQAALREKLDDLQARVGPQLAVLVVPTTKGEDIAAFATRAFAQWQLGTKKDDDGLLIVVALKDRRMRIEVGKGLESRVPDIVAGRIIDEQMAPRFRQSDVYGGIDAAVDALIDRLGGSTVVGQTEVGEESPVISTETPTEDASHERHLTPFGWAVLATVTALLGFSSYRWRAMRFLTAGLAVIVAAIWGVSHFVGNGESAFLIVIGGGFGRLRFIDPGCHRLRHARGLSQKPDRLRLAVADRARHHGVCRVCHRRRLDTDPHRGGDVDALRVRRLARWQWRGRQQR
ncbi:MAG: TPM domain-containing protein [Comamonadaceae bacterium]|nr:MAG: TPM domain-containing protein [Comamonadaceae bacterium]